MLSQKYGRDDAFFLQRGALTTAKEILQQPALWRNLAKLLTAQQKEIEAFMSRLKPLSGLRIILTGAGSSAFIGESLQMMLTREIGLASEAIATTDIVSAPEAVLMDVPTLLVSFSRSGESPESMEALKLASKHIGKLYNLVAVCKKDSSLAALAEQSSETLILNMPEGSSDLGFAMTSSISCMMLGTYLTLSGLHVAEYAAYINNLADSVEREFSSLDKLAREIAQHPYDRIIYLGSGGLKGLAHEGAIKSLELTNGKVNASHESPMGFRHGPKTVINKSTLTVHFISPVMKTQLYDLDLLSELVEQKGDNRQAAIAGKGCELPGKADYAFLYEPVGVSNKELTAYIKGLLFLQLLSLEKSMESRTPTDNPSTGGQVNRVVRGVVIH
ncbi:MAG: SIS domain-containing protein [Clostridiales bacterium]|jgi:tagatose-6-phosphate ketose/aldose isomerase|nr:SIS domain-containing protein [Clostridiales bacterium]